MGVDGFAKDTEEVGEKALVHISGHVIEYKPVTQRTMFHIMLYVTIIFILLEVSSDLPFKQPISSSNSDKETG